MSSFPDFGIPDFHGFPGTGICYFLRVITVETIKIGVFETGADYSFVVIPSTLRQRRVDSSSSAVPHSRRVRIGRAHCCSAAAAATLHCHTDTAAACLPFSARRARVASAATATVLPLFPLSLPLQPHVLPHLLVRCLQKFLVPAPASSSGRFVRQLRRDGETAPAAAARRMFRSCLRCGLPRLLVTRCCADCGVLCVRCGGREDAVSVVEDG